MSLTLQKVADILPALLRIALPSPMSAGFILEVEPAEMQALRDLSAKLETKARWERYARPVDGKAS